MAVYNEVPDVSFADWWTADNHDLYVRGNFIWIVENFGIMQLPLGAALLPLSGVASMEISQIESTAGDPKPNYRIAAADAGTDEWLQWEFTVPAIYASDPMLKFLFYSAGAIAGDAGFSAHVACISAGDAGVAAKAYDAINLSGAIAVPGVAGTETLGSITLTNDDSMAAGDDCNIGLFRDVSEDSVAGDLLIRKVYFVFTLG